MRDICITISSIRNSTAAGFDDKCSAVRALRVYLRPRFSLHRTENDDITLRYHSATTAIWSFQCIDKIIVDDVEA